MLCNGPTNRPHAYKGYKRKNQRKRSNLKYSNVHCTVKGEDEIEIFTTETFYLKHRLQICLLPPPHLPHEN